MITTLLGWYDKNKKSYPWRDISNPYYTYISEIMLQQTTTTTVLSYFNRFISQFPTISHLAEAGVDEVYFYWQGLGYYRRANNLHRTSKIIYENYSGKIPEQYDALMGLPGIGDYTAKAILSIAYNQNYLPIDGNVKRVMARYYGLTDPYEKLTKKISELSKDWEFENRPGDFCQALMDFANAICLPKNPLCNVCPLKEKCNAYKNQIFEIKKTIKEKKVLYTKAYVIKKDDKILLYKHGENGLLANLWNLPLSEFLESEADYQIEHVFTHIRLRISCHPSASEITKKHFTPTASAYFSLDEINNLALSTLAKKILKTL